MEESERKDRTQQQRMRFLSTPLGNLHHHQSLEELAISVPFSLIQEYFRYPLQKLADDLSISATMAKRICRRHNIEKWPYRQIKSLESMVGQLEALVTANTDLQNDIAELIAVIKEGLEVLRSDPTSFAGSIPDLRKKVDTLSAKTGSSSYKPRPNVAITPGKSTEMAGLIPNASSSSAAEPTSAPLLYSEEYLAKRNSMPLRKTFSSPLPVVINMPVGNAQTDAPYYSPSPLTHYLNGATNYIPPTPHVNASNGFVKPNKNMSTSINALPPISSILHSLNGKVEKPQPMEPPSFKVQQKQQ